MRIKTNFRAVEFEKSRKGKRQITRKSVREGEDKTMPSNYKVSKANNAKSFSCGTLDESICHDEFFMNPAIVDCRGAKV